MDVIKTSSNVEFDVIYADGLRRHVAEGVLWEADADGNLIYHQGTGRPEVVIAAAEDVLKYLKHIGPGLKALSVGMCLSADSAAALRELVSYALQLMDPERSVKQSIFRLGQMDMRESASARLRDAAANVYGIARATLESAADMIDEMETLK